MSRQTSTVSLLHDILVTQSKELAEIKQLVGYDKPVLKQGLILSICALVAAAIAIVIGVLSIIVYDKQRKLDREIQVDLYELCEPARVSLASTKRSLKGVQQRAEERGAQRERKRQI